MPRATAASGDCTTNFRSYAAAVGLLRTANSSKPTRYTEDYNTQVSIRPSRAGCILVTYSVQARTNGPGISLDAELFTSRGFALPGRVQLTTSVEFQTRSVTWVIPATDLNRYTFRVRLAVKRLSGATHAYGEVHERILTVDYPR